MRKWLLPLLAGAVHAAVIRGTVVENLTGHPISRASVMLEPVPGSGGKRMTARSDRYGFFEFAGEPAGLYLLQATRTPFFPAQYGQKRWNSSGMPLAVTESETPFVTIRLVRYGAIAGTVVDENDVGQPEFPVAAYFNTRPLQLAANATSDERGVYRIFGLLPGTYLVRSGAKQLDAIGYKPTFARETEVPDQSRTTIVEIEQQSDGVNVRPLPGQLFSLSVTAAATDPEDMPVTITFVHDMGRQVVQAAEHVFPGLVLGDYEVFAEAPTENPRVKQAGYQRLSLGRDSAVSLPLRRVQDTVFQFDGVPQQAVDSGQVKVLARRKDIAGFHDLQTLKLANNRVNLGVGPWEFALAPIDGYYVSGFSGPGNYRRNPHPEGWNEASISGFNSVRFSLSQSPGSVRGAVQDAGNPAIGAPVFLEPMDLELAKRVTPTYVAITDTHGQYRFAGLAPGRYRVLSSFEYQMPDSDTMVSAGAKELQIEAHTEATRDLDLYVIR